jgi:hypothetical protein
MNIERIDIARLMPADYNPRKALKQGDAEYEKLKRSLNEFGFVEPLVWNKTTGNVVGGHQRLTVLKDLGYTEADCVVVEMDAQKEKALNVALNRIQGEWDNDKLAAVLSDLDSAAFDVSLTGFDGAEIDELMNGFYAKTAVEDNFDEEKVKADIRVKGTTIKPGDIWRLGNHRLMCGDSGNAADLTKLTGGQRAQLAVTSPPQCGGKEYEQHGIDAWLNLIKPVVQNLTKTADIVCWNMGDMYATGTQFVEPTSVYSIDLFAEAGYRPIWIRIWRKLNADKAGGAYRLISNKPVPQYEYVTAFGSRSEPEYNDQEYCWVGAFAGHSYKFVKRLTKEERKKWGYAGIWDMGAVKPNNENKAVIPVELPWRCIKMHSDRGGIILDPFAGSGTTVIAAEQAERKCCAMEIEPECCDIIVRRWEEFTGEKAVRIC